MRLVPPEPAPAAKPAKKKSTLSLGTLVTTWWASFGGDESSSSKSWPAKGGSGAAHFAAGPWPKAKPREVWKPPPGWTPPKSGYAIRVEEWEARAEPISWHDAGLMLL